VSPTKLYELYKEKKINKSEFIDRIITIYEFSDSEKIRIECLRTIDSVNIRNERIFKFLEEIIISEPDIEVRLKATSLTLKNFPENVYNLVNYLFNSSESKEFIIRIAKIIGETMVSSNSNITIELYNSLKSMILKIFKNEDVRGFEILWGDWFYKVPEGFWDFLLELKDPIGLLEIMDYFISNHKVYDWFYYYLFAKFSFERWMLFLNNSRFSGRFLYILFYLEEENPPIRFYQIIELVEHFGKNLAPSQKNRIITLIKKNNQYNLTLILIFHWLIYFNTDLLRKLLEDSDANLIFKIKEVVSNTKFGFLKHDYFLFSVVLLLVKISKEIDEKYIIQFFKEISSRIRETLVSKLFKILNSKEIHKNSEIEKTYFIKIKHTLDEFLKILSKYYGFELLNP